MNSLILTPSVNITLYRNEVSHDTSAYTNRLINRITHRFDLVPLRTDSVSSFYRNHAVLRVQTNTGTYALKPFIRSNLHRSSTIEQMKTTANHMQQLMSQGFASMPHWLPSKSGKLWTLDQGRPFYITAWIHGRGISHLEEFEQLGRVLATLHGSTRHTPPIKSPFYDHIQLWQSHDRLFRKRSSAASRTSKWTRRLYNKYGTFCNQLSNQSWAELRNPEVIALLEKERSCPSLIHSDLTLQNVILADDGQLFIIDWDRVKLGSAYAEIVTALINTTSFHPENIRALLRGYEHLHPLEQTERRIIASLYQLPREAWSITRFPRASRSRSMVNIWEKTWTLRLQAIEIVNAWANQ